MARDETVAARGVMDGPGDMLLFGGLALLVIGMASIWLCGQLAGLLFAFSWPRAGIGDSLSILGRLPHHWSDPRQAWPAKARGSLPGLAGFVISFLLTVGGLGAGTVVAVRRWYGGRSVRGFASRRQLALALSVKAVLAKGPVVRPSLSGTAFGVEAVGVRIGRAELGGMPLAISSESSVLLIAAPRQGKTSSVMIPWLHRWPGAALVTSIRKDILEATAALRAEGGRPVLVMAPTAMVPWPDTVRWSPAAGCEDFDKARRRADVMVTIGKSQASLDTGNASYFGQTATNLLAGWLHAAALAGRSMDDVLKWALDDRDDEPVRLLRDHEGAAPGMAHVLDGCYRSPEGTKSNIWTTVQAAVAPLLSQAARAIFCPPHDQSIDLDDFLARKGTIYLLVDEKQASGLAPLISAFVDELTETAKRHGDASPGGRLDPPLGLFLDEVANVVPLPNLPDLMSYAGGSGIFVVAVLQSMAAAEERWGREGAAKIWGASTVKIALGGLSGEELADLSELAGIYRELLTTHQRGSTGHTIQSTYQDRKTITADQIRTLSEHERQALVIHATTPAVLVRLVRHYEGPDAKAYADSVTASTALIEAARKAATPAKRDQESLSDAVGGQR
jgi:type IV secretion system protein VirD4